MFVGDAERSTKPSMRPFGGEHMHDLLQLQARAEGVSGCQGDLINLSKSSKRITYPVVSAVSTMCTYNTSSRSSWLFVTNCVLKVTAPRKLFYRILIGSVIQVYCYSRLCVSTSGKFLLAGLGTKPVVMPIQLVTAEYKY